MIRLRTLGSVDLRASDDRVLEGVLAQPKRVALLAYLAVARPATFHRRDRLLALFWPELDDARARDALSQALRFLRQALGADVFLARGADEVGVDRARLWCDAVAFRASMDGGGASAALDLYSGDFLDGFFVEDASGFEEWAEAERSALRELAARGARQLAELYDGKGAHTVAVAWGRRAVELAPDDERAFRRLLGLLERAGDRVGALQAYDEFAHRLRAEYGAEPAAETRAMVEAMRRASGMPVVAVATPSERRVLSPDVRPVRRDGEASARSAPLGPGATLGDGGYVIERVLGEGGMATVYLARDVRHERQVAVKVLRSEVAATVGSKVLLREIRIAANLQHPHIVPLFDSGESDGRVFYVMPYVAGESLRARLEREPRLPLDAALRIARDMADALAYAHRQGIVHRDIKPDNVLLSGDPATGEFHAAVADFGVAKAIDASRTQTGVPNDGTLTAFGGVVGTPRYMAPEQAVGGRVDCRADLYAWGLVVYEMLAAEHPFEGRDTPQGLIAAHISEAPEPLERCRPDVNRELAALVMQCVEKDPIARPSDGGAMLAALESLPLPGVASRQRNASDVPANGAWGIRRMLRSHRVGGSSQLLSAAAASLSLLLAVAFAALRLVGFSGNDVDAAGAFDPRQIAVLDFEDQSPDQSLGHIASGLSVSLIRELSGASAIRVRSRNSVRSVRDRPLPFDSLVRMLAVGSLVEGTVQRSGDRLRVTVQLVDARTKTQLENATIERRLGELFLLEDDLAHEVARLLRRRIGEEVRVREMVAGTRSARARELVFRAEKLRDDADSVAALADTRELASVSAMLGRADSLLAAAEASDRRWTTPTVDRGWVALDLARLQAGALRDEAFARALQHANRTLARDAANAAAFELRGAALYWQAARVTLDDKEFRERLTRAKRDLEHGIQIDSSLATARGTLSLVRVALGDVPAAARDAQAALAMDAYLRDAPAILLALYTANLMNGAAADAWQWCDRGAHDYPRDTRFIDCRLTLLAEDDSRPPNAATAWTLVVKAREQDPPERARATGRAWLPIYREMMAGIVSARAGNADSARAVLRRARALTDANSDLGTDLTYEEAYLHLVLGERADAIRMLEAYLTARPSLRELVSRHPRWRALHGDSAFNRLTQGVTPTTK